MTENSEFKLIKNKETVQGLEDTIPHIIPQIGVKSNLEKLDNVKIKYLNSKSGNKSQMIITENKVNDTLKLNKH